jgi:PPK2 family polyphosphate:nucleotide phosphotransferase
MKISTKPFRVAEGSKINLKKWPTKVKPLCDSKECYETVLRDHVERLSKLQERFYADDCYALLIIFQAMDAAGKDSAIEHVMSGVNPQGCQVYSFKHPSPEELQHDFLWRSTRVLPERGRIGIFNRSYYEEVLIVRVHKEILRAERIPDVEETDKLWKHRFQSIRDFERHLHRNGTRIIKFFLHVSKDEQRKRFLKRVDSPEKNWKFSADDLKERAYWRDYMRAYEHALSATSTEDCPWYIVPADNKPDTRLIVSQVILNAMESLKPQPANVSPERRKELQQIRKKLAKR